MYEQRKPYKYGSVEEQIALYCINIDRQLRLTEAYFPFTDPAKASQLLRSYRVLLFPEDKYDDIKYIQKARRMFEKLGKMEITVRPMNLRAKKNRA